MKERESKRRKQFSNYQKNIPDRLTKTADHLRRTHYCLFAIPCLLLLMAAMLTACGGDGGSDAAGDSSVPLRFTTDNIQKICLTQPQLALQRLDTAEQKRYMTNIDVMALRSVIYNNVTQEYAKAATCAEKALSDENIRNHPDKEESLLNMLSLEYYSMGEYAKSLVTANRGLDIAYERKKPQLVAELLLTIGQCQMEMGNLKNAITAYDKSISVFQEIAHRSPVWNNYYNIVQTMGQKASALLDERNYDAMFEMQQQYEAMIRKTASMAADLDGSDDMSWATYYSLYAMANEHCGRHAEGRTMFDNLMKTRVSATSQGATFVVPYLLLTKQYAEALRRIEEEEADFMAAGRDTIDFYFSNNLLMNKSRALKGLGRYKEAIEQGMRAYNLSDSLNIHIREQNAMWLSESIGNKVLSKYIETQAEKLNRTQMLNTVIVGLLVIALIVLVFIIYYNRTIRRKNRAAARMITELSAYKGQLAQLLAGKEEPAGAAAEQEEDDADRDTFLRIEKVIAREELFLQPKLQKETVAERSGVPLSRVSVLFSKYSEVGFTGYINDMRLLYAAKLLKQQPNYSVEAVAHDCGLPVRQTFYRLFTKKFGITPAEYRNSVARQKGAVGPQKE